MFRGTRLIHIYRLIKYTTLIYILTVKIKREQVLRKILNRYTWVYDTLVKIYIVGRSRVVSLKKIPCVNFSVRSAGNKTSYAVVYFLDGRNLTMVETETERWYLPREGRLPEIKVSYRFEKVLSIVIFSLYSLTLCHLFRLPKE